MAEYKQRLSRQAQSLSMGKVVISIISEPYNQSVVVTASLLGLEVIKENPDDYLG